MNSLNDVKQKLFHDTEDEKPPIPPQILPLTIIIPKTPDDSVKQIESPFSGLSNVVVDLDDKSSKKCPK